MAAIITQVYLFTIYIFFLFFSKHNLQGIIFRGFALFVHCGPEYNRCNKLNDKNIFGLPVLFMLVTFSLTWLIALFLFRNQLCTFLRSFSIYFFDVILSAYSVLEHKAWNSHENYESFIL